MNHQNEMSTAKYWTDRAAEIDQEVADAAEYAQSPAGRIHTLQRKIDALYHLKVEQGMDTAAEIVAAHAEIEAIRAEQAAAEQAEFAQEWTREVTIARRAEWNALVKSGKFNKNGKVWMPFVKDAERRQGWTVEDLKQAVQMWEL